MNKKLCAAAFCALVFMGLTACGSVDGLVLGSDPQTSGAVQESGRANLSSLSQPDELDTQDIEIIQSASRANQSSLALSMADTEAEAAVHYQPVSLIRQNPDLPNGCEVTSMAMVLGSAGFPVDKMVLYGLLPRERIFTSSGRCFGPNPETAYAGDAASASGGWYCFEHPVMDAANIWLTEQGSDLQAFSVTGLTRSELDAYAGGGVPVVCWVTLGYARPRYSDYTWLLEDGSTYHPYSNLHCVVLAGAEDDTYQVADPISGISYIQKDLFWNSFSTMGRRAVIVE